MPKILKGGKKWKKWDSLIEVKVNTDSATSLKKGC